MDIEVKITRKSMRVVLTHKSMVQVPLPIITKFNNIWLRGELILGYYFGGWGTEFKNSFNPHRNKFFLSQEKRYPLAYTN